MISHSSVLAQRQHLKAPAGREMVKRPQLYTNCPECERFDAFLLTTGTQYQFNLSYGSGVYVGFVCLGMSVQM